MEYYHPEGIPCDLCAPRCCPAGLTLQARTEVSFRSFLSFHGQSTGSQSIFSFQLFPGPIGRATAESQGRGSEGTTTRYPVLPRRSSWARSPRRRSPARSPRAGGARSAAAVTASSSLGAAPDPGGASRPAAPAPGANCQGRKARVSRAPQAPSWWRTRTRSSPHAVGTPRTLGHPGDPSLALHSGLHPRRPLVHTHGGRHSGTHSVVAHAPEILCAYPGPRHTSRNSQALFSSPCTSPKQSCTTLSHCKHTSNPAGAAHPACTPTEPAAHTHRLLPAHSLTPAGTAP